MMNIRANKLSIAIAASLLASAGGALAQDVTVFNGESAFDAIGTIEVPIPDAATAFPGSSDNSCGASITGDAVSRLDASTDAQIEILFEDENGLRIVQDRSPSPQGSATGLCVFDEGHVRSTANMNPNEAVNNTIVANGDDDYLLTFLQPVSAVGFRLITNGTAQQTVELRDEDGITIESIDIGGDTDPNSREFIGFTSPEPIGSLRIDTTDGDRQNEGIDLIKVAQDRTTTNLCAAQDLDIGNVNVSNDADTLFVEFEITEPNWYLEETHVAVGSIDDMTNKGGNPVPGRFPYECESLGEQETACTIEIPRSDIDDPEDGFVNVAAHAVAYQLRGDGCDDELFFAKRPVIDNSQGTLVDSDTPVSEFDSDRSDPTAVFDANDGEFFSLGFDGSLTVGFGDRIYNGPGADVCAREVTNGRDGYPEEKAGVLIDDITPTPGEITNEGTSDDGGKACVGLPFDVISADSVTLFDTTNPELFDGTTGRLRSDADGYDVDWIAACYLADDETAWGGACEGVDDDVVGERFTKRGNWGTYFEYTIK